MCIQKQWNSDLDKSLNCRSVALVKGIGCNFIKTIVLMFVEFCIGVCDCGVVECQSLFQSSRAANGDDILVKVIGHMLADFGVGLKSFF